jgi:hypothetical protein
MDISMDRGAAHQFDEKAVPIVWSIEMETTPRIVDSTPACDHVLPVDAGSLAK